jgi:hypothetical protein
MSRFRQKTAALGHARRLAGRTLSRLLALGLCIHPAVNPALEPLAVAAGVGHPAARPLAARLGQVTIEALRARNTLKSVVDQFVFSTLVWFGHDGSPRRTTPVCPLVAGLTRAQGDFILARITRAARAAHAPLAGKDCHANLFVMVTSRPHLLLKLWWAKDRTLYDTRNGIAPVEQFIASKRPIHVWYNAGLGCSGAPLSPSAPENALAAAGVLVAGGGGVVCSQGVDTLLRNVTVLGFSSVIVVVDTKQLRHVTFGQLAAYVALVGLAQVNTAVDDGATPTILQLFQGADHAPQDLTAWDRALLYALYNSSPASTLQVSEINASVLKRISR